MTTFLFQPTHSYRLYIMHQLYYRRKDLSHDNLPTSDLLTRYVRDAAPVPIKARNRAEKPRKENFHLWITSQKGKKTKSDRTVYSFQKLIAAVHDTSTPLSLLFADGSVNLYNDTRTRRALDTGALPRVVCGDLLRFAVVLVAALVRRSRVIAVVVVVVTAVW